MFYDYNYTQSIGRMQVNFAKFGKNLYFFSPLLKKLRCDILNAICK